MKDPRIEYEAALADFRPKATWAALEAQRGKPTFVFWGKAAGMSANEIIADAHANGVANRDSDIRRCWNTAHPQGDRPHGDRRRYAPRATPKPPPTYPRYVRNMVKAGGGEASSADLLTMSPFDVPRDAATQTADFLRSLFDPADVLHIFRDDTPTAGRPNVNLMPCRDWLAKIDHGEAVCGDLIVSNVFTGAEAETTDGRKSYIAQSCLARFPFIVIEFDSIPLKVQAAFWRGLLATSPLAPKVAAIVFSGGKSLHGLLHVGCRTLADWQTVRGQLRGLFAADPDPSFRADEQAMRPRTGTRLPGVRRFSNGKLQRLLYLNPGAVRPTPTKPAAPTVRADPRGTPQTCPTIETDKEATNGDRRATARVFALPCDCAPLPPTMPRGDEPFEELLAALEVAEAWDATSGQRDAEGTSRA